MALLRSVARGIRQMFCTHPSSTSQVHRSALGIVWVKKRCLRCSKEFYREDLRGWVK